MRRNVELLTLGVCLIIFGCYPNYETKYHVADGRIFCDGNQAAYQVLPAGNWSVNSMYVLRARRYDGFCEKEKFQQRLPYLHPLKKGPYAI